LKKEACRKEEEENIVLIPSTHIYGLEKHELIFGFRETRR
jgi:hypothetical protein